MRTTPLPIAPSIFTHRSPTEQPPHPTPAADMIPQTSASCYPFVHTGAERAQLAADRAR